MTVRGLSIAESPAFTAEESARYRAEGWWIDGSISDAVHRNAERTPGRAAYIDHPDGLLTWHEFDRAAASLAHQLAGAGIGAADRVAVWHGDTAAIHVLFVAIERCGAVVVGIGARAGTREVAAILRGAQPRILITDPARSESTGPAIEGAMACLVLDPGTLSLNSTAEPAEPRAGLSPDDVFLINSTSGTTGLPKCVVHTQNRWHYFHQKAVANGELTGGRRVSARSSPRPFGFGIWTSHTTPIHLGATAVLHRAVRRRPPRARPSSATGSTVLCCVSTQLAMILADPASPGVRPELSLRVVFTGGEPLPYTQAAEFEELTGVTILQFYGSNETGHAQCDHRRRSAATAGCAPPAGSCRRCRCGCSTAIGTSPSRVAASPRAADRRLSLGYLGGTDHDKLFTKDGWMRMGDICELDADGYLTLTGRTSDFILRGGKNISAVAGRGGRRDPSRRRRGGGRRHARPGLRRAGLRVRRAQTGSRALDLPDTRRTPVGAGRFQGAAARTTRSPRRTAALVGRQDRQRPTSRGYPTRLEASLDSR